MTIIICTDCMAWHDEPRCGHKPEAKCAGCGNKIGYRFTLRDRTLAPADQCWECQRVWEAA